MYKAGDNVLLVESYGAKPVEVTIDRVTPTGQIVIGGRRFCQSACDAAQYDFTGTSRGVGKRVYDVGRLEQLTKEHVEFKAAEEEKANRRQAEIAERNRQFQAELSETKAIIPEIASQWIDLSESVSVVTYILPVQPTSAKLERLGDKLFVVIRIVRAPQNSWQPKPFEFSVTWTAAKGGGSFPSCSSDYADTPEEAILLGCNRAYQSW